MDITLLVLAAGMGSRYGGLKQLDKLGPSGETIMDYSIFDAIRGGFTKVVFVIRKDFEADFRAQVLSKYQGKIKTTVVFQDIHDLPEGFTCPAERTKPWGTNHAVLMAKDVIDGPFCVINADDFYGRDTFAVMGKFLKELPAGAKNTYSMVGFRVSNTLSENGTVSRGVCTTDKNNYLQGVVERTKIIRKDGQVVYLDENENWVAIPDNTPVSMNVWGFTPDYFEYSEKRFVEFLQKDINTPKSEYFIPIMVNDLIRSKKATLKVLDTTSVWFGVTYSEDRPGVVERFASLAASGEYPSKLF